MFDLSSAEPLHVAFACAFVVSADAAIIAFMISSAKWKREFRPVIRFPIVMALYHAMISVCGWLMASPLETFLSEYAFWILVALIAALCFRAAFTLPLTKDEKSNPSKYRSPMSMLALAASVDSLIAGIVAVTIGMSAWIMACIVGGACLILAASAFALGSRLRESDRRICCLE